MEEQAQRWTPAVGGLSACAFCAREARSVSRSLFGDIVDAVSGATNAVGSAIGNAVNSVVNAVIKAGKSLADAI